MASQIAQAPGDLLPPSETPRRKGRRKRRSAPKKRSVRHVALLAGLPLACVLGAAGFALYQSVTEKLAEEHLTQQDALLARGYALVPQNEPYHRPASPRAILMDALLRARAAQEMNRLNPDRPMLLRQAESQLAEIADARPNWGQYWVTRAYVSALRHGERAPATVAQINRSYETTPYIRQSADWRVDWVLRNWDLLSPHIQAIAIKEMVWLARRDYADIRRLMPLIRETDAYSPFMVEWLATRNLDRDLAPVKGLPPQ